MAEMRRAVPAGTAAQGLGIDEVPLSCGGSDGQARRHTDRAHVDHMITDDGGFVSRVTNTFSNNADAWAEAADVLDSALCEGNNA
jgi:D-alanyl-D-alanine carboxypeptidase